MTSPAGTIEPISIEDLGRLGIDTHDQLFWDGRRIEIRRRLDLTRRQKFLAILVTLSAVLGGFGAIASASPTPPVFCANATSTP